MVLLAFNLSTDQIILNLAIGLIAGFLAKLVTNNKGGLIVCILVGIVGSFVGQFVFEQFEIESAGTLGRLAASLVGGCLFAWLANSFTNH